MNYDEQMSDMTAAVETMPRVNKQMMQRYRGQTVSIVGKYEGQDQNDSSMHRFSSPDNQVFMVKTGQMFNGYNSTFVEIQGTVMDGNTIQEESHQEWGNEFALATWNKFVMLTHQFPNIF